jgi:phage gp29-like protein
VVAPALRVVTGGTLPRKAPTGAQARSLPRDATTDHPGYGCTPQRLVAVYRAAEDGNTWEQCELFDDFYETDAHLRNLFDQRAQAVSGKPRVIKADGPDEADALAAAALSEAVRSIGSDYTDGDPGATMTEAIEHLLTFNRYGFAGAELFWGVRTILGRDWVVPYKVRPAPHRRFALNPRTEELVLINDPYLYQSRQGVPLWPGKWITVRRSGQRVARSGLMRTAGWNCLAKRFATRDLIVYSEKFGLPMAIVTYAESNDDTAKDVATLIAENIGNDGSAVVPEGVKVEIVDAIRSDSSGVHGGLISHVNRENSKLVNGSTLANDNGDSGGASYALGDVHASVRWEAVQYDAERIQDAFRTQIAVPFCIYNGLDGAKPPTLQIQVVRDLEPKTRVEMAEKLVAMGLDLSISQMRMDTGFAGPINAQDTLKPPAPPTPAGGGAPSGGPP